ncbi:MAG: deoxyguanosinetriphosphate triphosphohydrolase [Burkholderiaceae bacterium]
MSGSAQTGPLVAPFAAQAHRSRGRLHPESEPMGRSAFQRDRDRIVHSTAFRKLLYKTQVFVNHEGDLFRTRLTHSLEVAQIARSVARRLQLDEELTEAICLAHDLGHTPFGHAGQHALNQALRDATAGQKGFEHNLQSLRVVDKLEQRYAAFDGLNLTFETREGILKHCADSLAQELGEVAHRFIKRESPSLEAQLANLADELAYNHHDLDDGLRSGLLVFEEVIEQPLVAPHVRRLQQAHPQLARHRLMAEVIRGMINEQVDDLTQTTRQQLLSQGIADDQDVRRQALPLVGFSPELGRQVLDLKRFLRQRLYRHPRVVDMTNVAERVIHDLFGWLLEQPCDVSDGRSPHRRAADEIAGMTDRYAALTHARVFPGRACWPSPIGL